VAGGADFAVDLEASTKRGVVESLGQFRVFPWVLNGVKSVV
jgi:hypothetical protein